MSFSGIKKHLSDTTSQITLYVFWEKWNRSDASLVSLSYMIGLLKSAASILSPYAMSKLISIIADKNNSTYFLGWRINQLNLAYTYAGIASGVFILPALNEGLQTFIKPATIKSLALSLHNAIEHIPYYEARKIIGENDFSELVGDFEAAAKLPQLITQYIFPYTIELIAVCLLVGLEFGIYRSLLLLCVAAFTFSCQHFYLDNFVPASSREEVNLRGSLSKKYQQSVSFYNTIKRFSRENQSTIEINAAILPYISQIKNTEFLKFSNSIVQSLLLTLAIFLYIYLTITADNQLTGDKLEEFTFFSSYLLRYAAVLRGLGEMKNFASSSNVKFNRILKLISACQSLIPISNELQSVPFTNSGLREDPDTLVVIKDVTFSWNRVRPLDNIVYQTTDEEAVYSLQLSPPKLDLQKINIVIKKGQRVAFVGMSGSGKSTLIEILMKNFNNCTSSFIGNIWFNISGKMEHFVDIDYSRVVDFITHAPPRPDIFHGTLSYNICYGDTRIKNIENIKNIEKQRYEDSKQLAWLDSGEIEEEKLLTSDNISSGQAQRIGLARTLMKKNTKLYIFDEPTSALDSFTEAGVMHNIKVVASNTNAAVIIIAHRLSTIIDCDCIYVFSNGKIIAFGTHSELNASDDFGGSAYYRNAYGLQSNNEHITENQSSFFVQSLQRSETHHKISAAGILSRR